nr:MAG TPA: hypothetical protein [Caudoviricetes sp.]
MHIKKEKILMILSRFLTFQSTTVNKESKNQ